MFDRVGDELVDQESQDRGLLRGNLDIRGRNIEGYRKTGWGQRPVRLVGGVAGNDVDCRPAETLLVAEKIVHGRDRLDATDRFA
jgi:hypothetical protein